MNYLENWLVAIKPKYVDQIPNIWFEYLEMFDNRTSTISNVQGDLLTNYLIDYSLQFDPYPGLQVDDSFKHFICDESIYFQLMHISHIPFRHPKTNPDEFKLGIKAFVVRQVTTLPQEYQNNVIRHYGGEARNAPPPNILRKLD